jgi:hypothetical protein
VATIRCSGSRAPGSGLGPGTGHFAESAGLRTNGRGPRGWGFEGAVSGKAESVSAAVSRGGATTGFGTHSFGLGGDASADAESRAPAFGREASPHPMAAPIMMR